MRSTTRLLVLAAVLLYAQPVRAQLLFTEDFLYPAGDSLKNHGWEPTSGSLTNAILVTEPGLTIDGYPGSGNCVTLQSSGQDVARSFSPDSTGAYYVFFLLRVLSARAGDYFLYLAPSATSTAGVARTYARLAANGYLTFGIAKKGTNSSPTYVFSDSTYVPDSTYLIVVKYAFLPDSGIDDQVSLFVFPAGSLPASEPSAPTVGPATDATTDASNLSALVLRQGDASRAPNVMIDGIRLSRTWEPPLPVVLASFAAHVHSNNVVALQWVTLSETNCYGFEVQRSDAPDGPFMSIPGGFLAGQGTSLMTHTYVYHDTVPSQGMWYYRLRQIDLSGGSSYSEIILADIATGAAGEQIVTPSLLQNYPNPFNPSTRIRFVPQESGNALLEIFSVAGERVAVVFEGSVRRGEQYETILDGTNLAAGTYFCRLTAGGSSLVSRMLLVR